MTLMEAVVALVILSLVGVGCLELAQGASRLEYSAVRWNSAITLAESRMAQLTSGAPESTPSVRPDNRAITMDSAMHAGLRVTRESWRPGLDIVSVTVPVVDGKQYTLRRIVPSSIRPSSSRSSSIRQ